MRRILSHLALHALVKAGSVASFDARQRLVLGILLHIRVRHGLVNATAGRFKDLQLPHNIFVLTLARLDALDSALLGAVRRIVGVCAAIHAREGGLAYAFPKHRITVSIARAAFWAKHIRRQCTIVAGETVAAETTPIFAVAIARAVFGARLAAVGTLELWEAGASAIEAYPLSTALVGGSWAGLGAAIFLSVPRVAFARQPVALAVLRAVTRACGLTTVIPHPTIFAPTGAVIAIAICALILAREPLHAVVAPPTLLAIASVIPVALPMQAAILVAFGSIALRAMP